MADREIARKNRIEALEQNEKKQKWILAVVVLFLVVCFFGMLGWGINEVLLNEGSVSIPAASASALPTDAAESIAYVRTALAGTEDPLYTKAAIGYSVSIGDIELADESLQKTLSYLLDTNADPSIESEMEAFYEDYAVSSSFGEAFDALPAITFTPENLRAEDGWSAEYGYFDKNEQEQKDTDTLYQYFRFPEQSFAAAEKAQENTCFSLSEAQPVQQKLVAALADVMTVGDTELTCDGFEICCKSSRLTDRLQTVSCTRRYRVRARVEFIGEWAQLGAQELQFVYKVTKKFSFTWAGVTLSETSLWLEKGDTEMLEAFKNADEEVSVVWSSDNEAVATVDADGYVDAVGVSETPAHITASFEYLGKQFSQTCTVWVVKPIDEVHVSEKEKTVTVGDSFTLTVTVKPEKATIKTVKWYTEDEAIASVDPETGAVTAVAPGTVKVYALTTDGGRKTTCTVTVKEEGADIG